MANYSNDYKLKERVKKEAPELHNELFQWAYAKQETSKEFYDEAAKSVKNWYRTWRKENYFALRVLAAIVSLCIVPLIYRLHTGKFWLFPKFLLPLQKEFKQQIEALDKQPLLANAQFQEADVQERHLKRHKNDRRLRKLNVVQGKRGDKRLGSGAFGQVFEAEHPDDSDTTIAVKVLKRADMDNTEKQKQLRHEETMMTKVNNPYVVKSFGMLVSDRGLGIMMEYVPGADLDYLLSESSVPLDWRQQFTIAKEVALGLKAIHAAGLVHADLKSDNIFVWKEEQSQGWVRPSRVTWHIKIGDFGLSHEEGEAIVGGTRLFMAPEVWLNSTETVFGLLDYEIAPKGTSQEADVYAMGVVFSHVATRTRPFDEYLNHKGNFRRNERRFIEDVEHGERESNPLRPTISKGIQRNHPGFVGIFTKCWQSDPKGRPSVVEVLDEMEKLPQPSK